MRFLPIAAVMVAAGFGLAGCNAANISAQISDTVTAVEAEAAAVCHYLAPVAAVITIVNKSAGDTAAQIGDAICTALGSPPKTSARLRAAVSPLVVSPGVVNGVVITGGTHF